MEKNKYLIIAVLLTFFASCSKIEEVPLNDLDSKSSNQRVRKEGNNVISGQSKESLSLSSILLVDGPIPPNYSICDTTIPSCPSDYSFINVTSDASLNKIYTYYQEADSCMYGDIKYEIQRRLYLYPGAPPTYSTLASYTTIYDDVFGFSKTYTGQNMGAYRIRLYKRCAFGTTEPWVLIYTSPVHIL